MTDALKFLLLQIRNPNDPMRHHEVESFARALGVAPSQIAPHDLVTSAPADSKLAAHDLVLIGGSGDYSVVAGGDWLPPALACMRHLVEIAKPTFASCWGFQAMALALGGHVVTDLSLAEIGTPWVWLTAAGRADQVFGQLPVRFPATMGHQDIVLELPAGAELLVSSDQVRCEAFRMSGLPIYATQFHPELTREGLLARLVTYPEYVEKIAGQPAEEFFASCQETPECNRLMRYMVEEFFQ